MKWKRSHKTKEQVEAAQECKSTNENLALEPQEAELGKQNIQEEEEADDENDFNTDTQHSDFSDDDMDEMSVRDGKMGVGL